MVEENIIKSPAGNKLWIRLLCAFVILASGIAIGAGGTILLVKHRVIWISKAHMDANSLTKLIAEKYDLDSQQTGLVRELINDAFVRKNLNDEAESARREMYAQKMITDMNSILTPQQFQRWSKDFQEMRERYKKRNKR
ncbi:MAG: hypothetical protein BWY69_00521 [Planctomycetes bacterium ADurb.Bin401]|nr:MAG: hypothetical protein BWY69_00521 [Planctomycetes bacterium ADurb.Bin401]